MTGFVFVNDIGRHSKAVSSIHLSAEGRVASASADGTVNILNLDNLDAQSTQFTIATSVSNGINDVKWFNNNDSLIVTASDDKMVRVFDVEKV